MFRFKCGSCDAWHESAPSLACQVPDALLHVPPPQRRARVKINGDIAMLDEKQFFIRSLMQVPIVGTGEHFLLGLWAEVTEEDFSDYCETSAKGTIGGPYRGTLANTLPFYPDAYGIEVEIRPEAADKYPLLFAPEGDSGLARDLRNGMSEESARAYFERVLHPGPLH